MPKFELLVRKSETITVEAETREHAVKDNCKDGWKVVEVDPIDEDGWGIGGYSVVGRCEYCGCVIFDDMEYHEDEDLTFCKDCYDRMDSDSPQAEGSR